MAHNDSPRIAHIGIAVDDIDEAISFYRNVFGMEPGDREFADGAEIVSLSFGDTDIELLEPREPDSPIAKFLANRGPGIHHICLRVSDVEAALRKCTENGYRLVDSEPRTGAGGHRIAFLHPKSTSGVLIELTD